jgi:hypothetical protein
MAAFGAAAKRRRLRRGGRPAQRGRDAGRDPRRHSAAQLKLAAFIGLMLGAGYAETALLAGVVMAAVMAIAPIALRMKHVRDGIAYGPFLAAGVARPLPGRRRPPWVRSNPRAVALRVAQYGRNMLAMT